MPLYWGFIYYILKNSLHFPFISCIINLYRLARHSLNKVEQHERTKICNCNYRYASGSFCNFVYLRCCIFEHLNYCIGFYVWFYRVRYRRTWISSRILKLKAAKSFIPCRPYESAFLRPQKSYINIEENNQYGSICQCVNNLILLKMFFG